MELEMGREQFKSRPGLTPLEADRVAALAYRIAYAANDSLHAYPNCNGLRVCLSEATEIIRRLERFQVVR